MTEQIHATDNEGKRGKAARVARRRTVHLQNGDAPRGESRHSKMDQRERQGKRVRDTVARRKARGKL